jgi:hypothetical protein
MVLFVTEQAKETTAAEKRKQTTKRKTSNVRVKSLDMTNLYKAGYVRL